MPGVNNLMEVSFRIPSSVGKGGVYRQWRNWRTGLIIETVENASRMDRDPSWDKEFEPVVLFYKSLTDVVFCDPLVEVLKKSARYDGCEIIRLDQYNSHVPEDEKDLLALLSDASSVRQALLNALLNLVHH